MEGTSPGRYATAGSVIKTAARIVRIWSYPNRSSRKPTILLVMGVKVGDYLPHPCERKIVWIHSEDSSAVHVICDAYEIPWMEKVEIKQAYQCQSTWSPVGFGPQYISR